MAQPHSLKLLPAPRWLEPGLGEFVLPERVRLYLDASLSRRESRSVANRIRATQEQLSRNHGQACSLVLSRSAEKAHLAALRGRPSPDHPEGYTLRIHREGVLIEFREVAGLFAAVATLRQLIREKGRRLPCLYLRDWPDFPRRGVMLDVSRGRVPKLQTLLDLVDHLADFKINEFQLYTEHTFAYRRYQAVWRSWGALTGAEIRTLDARCQELGIDLVPNQNSFGHLRYFLEHPSLRQLAEVSEPYEADTGDFVRRPSTLAPDHPGTLPFLRGLYDELLPNFTSRFFNVGCDETWDLGRGQSRERCKREGKGRVYLDFLHNIHREVAARGRQMMFWGDIILHHPQLIKELPGDGIALNWGYEANHPFDREARLFARSGIPFYVCPGTSTWMTLIGRHDNALANLHTAAKAGLKHGAIGYLITDWGDGGHPQPLAVSYLPFLAGAALSWCGDSFDEEQLVGVLSRDVFCDDSQRLAQAALELGFAHRKFEYFEPNVTPFGAVIAAPLPESRELFCRNGLRYYSRIKRESVQSALREVEKQRHAIRRAHPKDRLGRILAVELDLAARMAEQSCRIMLWQQAREAGNRTAALAGARAGIRELGALGRDFKAYWPLRNKAAPGPVCAFLEWRTRDYLKGIRELSTTARQ